jgi:anti-sigma B factor antagonist
MAFFSRATNTAPDAEMQMVCQQDAIECRVLLSGRITIDTSPHLRDALLERVNSANCQTLVLDLDKVEYIDTSGLAVLVETLRAARTQGKKLRLSRLGERPRYLLETTRLLHLFGETPSGTPQVPSP